MRVVVREVGCCFDEGGWDGGEEGVQSLGCQGVRELEDCYVEV